MFDDNEVAYHPRIDWTFYGHAATKVDRLRQGDRPRTW